MIFFPFTLLHTFIFLYRKKNFSKFSHSAVPFLTSIEYPSSSTCTLHMGLTRICSAQVRSILSHAIQLSIALRDRFARRRANEESRRRGYVRAARHLFVCGCEILIFVCGCEVFIFLRTQISFRTGISLYFV